MNDRMTGGSRRKRPMGRLLAVPVILALLSGCVSTAGLHPQATQLSADELQTSRTLGTRGAGEWPTENWWSRLGDPQLSGLMAEAFEHSPDLVAADARARQASAQAAAADAQRGPRVDANVQLNGQRQSPSTWPAESGGGTFGWSHSADVGFSWGLDLWGGQRAAWLATLGQMQVAQIETQAARIQLSTHVARAYTQLGQAFIHLDICDTERRRAEEVLTLTRQRQAQGLDGDLQRQQAEGALTNASQQIAVAERSVMAARMALAILIGRGPDRGLEIARPSMLPAEPLSVPADLPGELLGRRADLVAARKQVEVAARRIDAAKAQFLPNVSVTALIGFAAQSSANLFSLANRQYQIAPAFNLPIFDAGRLRAGLAEQDALYDQAVAHYNKTLISALGEVAEHLDAMQSLRRQINIQRHVMALAQASWDIAKQRYRSGVGSYLEVLSAQQPLLDAEQKAATLNAEQIDLSVRLIGALGGGFRTEQQSPVAATCESTSNSSFKELP